MVDSLNKFIIVDLMALFVSSSESKHKLHEVSWLDRFNDPKDCVDEVLLGVVSTVLCVVLLEGFDHVIRKLRVQAFLVYFTHHRE